MNAPTASELVAQGYAERSQKNLAAARDLYQQAADLYRVSGPPLRLAHTVRQVADILRNMNRCAEADLHYREALDLYRGHPDASPLDLANTLRGHALNQSDPERARPLWLEARDLYAQVDGRNGMDLKPGIDDCNHHLNSL